MSGQKKQKAEAWKQAKKLCRLNDRQVAMARVLGLNPKKLPRLNVPAALGIRRAVDAPPSRPA